MNGMSRFQRLLIPVFPVFSLAMTIRCLFAERKFYAAAAPSVSKVMPMDSWGILWGTVLSLLLIGLCTASRSLYGIGLGVFALSMSVWGVALWFAAIETEDTLALPWIWPFSMSYIALVFMTSLVRTREQIRVIPYDA